MHKVSSSVKSLGNSRWFHCLGGVGRSGRGGGGELGLQNQIAVSHTNNAAVTRHNRQIDTRGAEVYQRYHNQNPTDCTVVSLPPLLLDTVNSRTSSLNTHILKICGFTARDTTLLRNLVHLTATLIHVFKVRLSVLQKVHNCFLLLLNVCSACTCGGQ